MAINSEGRGSRFKGYFVMDLSASLSVFPYPVHCNADAALYVENTGVIVSGNCRVQPPFSKWHPGWLPGRQVDSIRNMKKARVFRR